MAYMRGTYYFYRTGGGGFQMHVGQPLQGVDSAEFTCEYYDAGCKPDSLRVPFRVMQDLAAKIWIEMPTSVKESYLKDHRYEPYRVRAHQADAELT